MPVVDDEYRLLTRTGRLGPVLVHRLRELRGRPVVHVARSDPAEGKPEAGRTRFGLRWVRLVRPPG